jgi:tetratricopeptide (TPR) repeat protein
MQNLYKLLFFSLIITSLSCNKNQQSETQNNYEAPSANKSVSEEKDLDSLFNLLDNGQFENICEIYNEIANASLKKREMNTCYDYSKEAYTLSIANDDDENLMIASNNLGLLNYILGDFDTAIYFLNKSLELAERFENKKEKIKAYNSFAFILEAQNDIDSAQFYYESAIELAREIDDKEQLSKSLINIGPIYQQQGKTLYAIDAYEEALKLKKEVKDIKGIGTAYYQLGNVYLIIDILELALDNFKEALPYFEQLEDFDGIAAVFNGIGLTYDNMRLYDKSIIFYNKSLEIYESLDLQNEIANIFNNIGIVLIKKGDYYRAIENLEKALEIRKEQKDFLNIAKILQNIGMAKLKSQNYNESLKYFREALNINQEQQNLAELAANLHAIGIAYTKLGKFSEAEEILNTSTEIANKLNFKNQLKENYKAFSDLYKEKNEFRKAYDYYEKFFMVHDSTLGNSMQERMINLQIKYEAEKKIRKDEKLKLRKTLKNMEIEKAKTEKKLNNSLKIFLSILVLFIVFISAISYILLRFRKLNKQIEHKNTEILSSINYAKRIQTSILENENKLRDTLPNSFLFYQPKDIVSGDFYWFTKLNQEIIIVTADCTGHGVPGAFMSLIGVSLLNKIVNERRIIQPEKILDTLRKELIDTLHQYGHESTEIKDSIDATIVKLNQHNKTIEFAGAYHSLFIKNGESVTELKGDRMPIGFSHRININFTNQTHYCKENDFVFMSTDGYFDQFGGDYDKKFKRFNFVKLISSIKKSDVKEVKEIIVDEFEEWKGENEQIDDVLVLGFKI